jgi:K(+)-stimulated pyrophosphate-energized sodium pump
MAFLKAEYRVLAVFVVCVAALLAAINMSPGQSPLIAAVPSWWAPGLSAIAGWAGMRMATYANVRTTAAARLGLPQALNVAFKGGSVMGMTVVGLALIGMAVLFIALLPRCSPSRWP